jgi:hypothetical protein
MLLWYSYLCLLECGVYLMFVWRMDNLTWKCFLTGIFAFLNSLSHVTSAAFAQTRFRIENREYKDEKLI